MENATPFRKDDREAASSGFASADELHISYDFEMRNLRDSRQAVPRDSCRTNLEEALTLKVKE
ncbi:hypothetical protein Scep_026099 [Stephania cephalantha]|uniref:Uncharacterized protein n=1 Tax=Stephania cephalantha TaxID=152367 RepID=A0AAP0EJG8_9MAGN